MKFISTEKTSRSKKPALCFVLSSHDPNTNVKGDLATSDHDPVHLPTSSTGQAPLRGPSTVARPRDPPASRRDANTHPQSPVVCTGDSNPKPVNSVLCLGGPPKPTSYRSRNPRHPVRIGVYPVSYPTQSCRPPPGRDTAHPRVRHRTERVTLESLRPSHRRSQTGHHGYTGRRRDSGGRVPGDTPALPPNRGPDQGSVCSKCLGAGRVHHPPTRVRDEIPRH